MACTFLTGAPGVGKTTAVKEIVKYLKQHQVTVLGLYTEEVREANRCRSGFDVVSIADPSHRTVLARTHPHANFTSSFSVGQYSVNVPAFENFALELFQAPEVPGNSASTAGDAPHCYGGPLVIVIDEIGKMELCSQRFQQKVEQLVQICRQEATCHILATIPIAKGPRNLAFVEKLLAEAQPTVVEVTRKNRDVIVKEIASNFLAQIHKSSTKCC